MHATYKQVDKIIVSGLYSIYREAGFANTRKETIFIWLAIY